jgi:hypothetical protein
MDLIKKHYEKVILIVVLLGVVGFLVFLPFIIAHDQDVLRQLIEDSTTSKKVQPLADLDLTRQAAISRRVASPPKFDFSSTNRLFNPLEWKKRSDGTIFPVTSANQTDASAAVVTKITPLYFIVTFESVETNKQQRYISAGEKKDFFILSAVNGDPADPSGLVLKLTDTGDTVTVSKDKPFQRVEAYSADLKYELEKPVKNFAGLRIGSRISFGGEDYIVVAVDADELILSAQSNQKKTTLPFTR